MKFIHVFTTLLGFLSLGMTCNIPLPDTAGLPTCYESTARDLNNQLNSTAIQAGQLESIFDLAVKLQNLTSYLNRLQVIKSNLLKAKNLLQEDMNGATGATGATGTTFAACSVPNCLSCYSPNQCSVCNSGYVLNFNYYCIRPEYVGRTGSTGATGPIGMPGLPGMMGDSGIMGMSGPTGATGQQGVYGATGFPGMPGQPGPTGETGFTGATGGVF